MNKLKSVFFLMILTAAGLLFAQRNLPTCYQTYAQIFSELTQLEAQYPNIAKIHIIGYSQEDNLPIYALKISDNVLLEEEEPAVFLVGQVHAEEVLGVQITMSNIREILTNQYQSPYGSWISQLEMWFIPTLNPEGHNVVTSNMDVFYRKNKRDTNNNGIFDYVPGEGQDLDGVDLNRNFAFNWIHGDSLYTPGGNEPYDYYRGSAPLSESETQAFKALCDAHKPVYAIVWHSSRTGNLSEKLYYPFNWYGVRPSPDLLLAQQIGQGVASQIPKETGTGSYEYFASEGRKGNAHDWMYQQYGTICLLIECGTRNLQPDSLLMVDTVQRCTNGVRWFLNRALIISPGLVSNSMLTGTIKDAVTLQPLEAEIIVEQKHAAWFRPRKSDPVTGRYWRPITNGNYTLRYRKKGYHDTVLSNAIVNNSAWTTHNALLTPIPPAVITGNVTGGSQPLAAQIILHDVENDTLQVNGSFILNTYHGTHKIEVTAQGYFPYFGNLEVSAGIHQLEIELSPAATVFSEDWENGTSNWLLEGGWALKNNLSGTGYAITDSTGGKGFYPMNCNMHITTLNPVNLPSAGNLILKFDQHLYTEWTYDSVRVEVSTDNQNWQVLYSRTGQYDWWHPVYISLDNYSGQSIYLRFRLTDQSTDFDLTDPGWILDNIKIISGTATLTPNADDTLTPLPAAFLHPNFPNPFNPDTNIRFSLSRESDVRLEIYNQKGQKVRTLSRERFAAGTHSLVWNGKDDAAKDCASGIYFYRLKTDGYVKSRKMLLLK